MTQGDSAGALGRAAAGTFRGLDSAPEAGVSGYRCLSYADPFGLCPGIKGTDPKNVDDCPDESQRSFWDRFWNGPRYTEIDGKRYAIAMGVVPSWLGGPATKAVNLPAWKNIAIDMEHIASGHMLGGSRVSALKTLFPEAMSESQVEGAVRAAYRYGKKISTQGERVLVRGQAAGLTIEMWVNKAEKLIETAYPVW